MGSGFSRRSTRPHAWRGTSGRAAVERSARASERLAVASDQAMWWGWVIAVAFVLSGLGLHLFTYRSDVFRQTETTAASRSVESAALYGE